MCSGSLGLAAACAGDDSTLVSEGAERPLAGASPAAQPRGSTLPLGPEGAASPGPQAPAGPVGPPDTIFEREHLIEVRIEMAPEDFEALSFEGMGMREILFPASGFRDAPEYTRFAARVTVDGVLYPEVDIRKKGYIGSLSVIRPSLKLDFERRLGRELVAGNRRMTLNNDLQDPSHVRQCLSYDLFREVGLPASRCNYAHVVVNGVDLGIYSHVESVNKPMLRRHFADPDGNLYEGQLSDFDAATQQHLELDTNEERGDRSDVQAVVDALALPDEQVAAALGELVNLEQFIDFWALETLLGHWDGYSGNSNNYYAYHDPTTDKFHFIPWGTDQTFVGDNPNDNLPYLIQVYAAGALSSRLYALPEQRERYRQRLAELNDALWVVPELLERVQTLQRLAPDASRAAVTRLESYIRSHGEALRAALAEPAPEWPVAPPPPPPDPCQGTFSEVSGTFSTVWGGTVADIAAIGTQAPEAVELALQLDGAPFAGAFRALAGEGGFLPGAATLRFVAPREDGPWLLVDLLMPLELFEPGYHPLHSFESLGAVVLLDPLSGQFFQLGLIGDGGVQLDTASLEVGGEVSGTFGAQVSYFVCASTIESLLSAPPPAGGLEPAGGEGAALEPDASDVEGPDADDEAPAGEPVP